jgi:hypothetical protein
MYTKLRAHFGVHGGGNSEARLRAACAERGRGGGPDRLEVRATRRDGVVALSVLDLPGPHLFPE